MTKSEEIWERVLELDDKGVELIIEFENNNRIIVKRDCPFEEESERLGKMYCFYKTLNFGDVHDFSSPEEFEDFLLKKDNIHLPMYFCDDGGPTIRTKPFSGLWGTWGSGQIGWIVADIEKIKRYFGCEKINDEIKERTEDVLIREVARYNDWINEEQIMLTEIVNGVFSTCTLQHGDDALNVIQDFLEDNDLLESNYKVLKKDFIKSN